MAKKQLNLRVKALSQIRGVLGFSGTGEFRRYTQRVNEWLEEDPSRLLLSVADESARQVMAPLVEELYDDWWRSSPRQSSDNATELHKEAWLAMISCRIRERRRIAGGLAHLRAQHAVPTPGPSSTHGKSRVFYLADLR